MRLLHVEDQEEFRIELRKKLDRKVTITPYVGKGADGKELDLYPHQNASDPIEDQIANQLKEFELKLGAFDAVLLDTDLSGLKNGISQSSIRTACSQLGIPVFRYSKRGLVSPQERMKYLATIAREGSQSILVPQDVLSGNGLSEWLLNVTASFTKIRKAIETYSKDRILSPAELLAKLLKLPGIDIDLMGYSGANFFFFGDLIEKIEPEKPTVYRNYSTQFGYWLCNYVLLFPGPIMNIGATAAYLELSKQDITNIEIAKLLEKAKYKGPFAELGPYYIKQLLDGGFLEIKQESYADYFKSKGIKLAKRQYKLDDSPSYYCVVNDEPISAKNSKGPLDWIPRGAHMCRIKKETYDKFGPWLNV